MRPEKDIRIGVIGLGYLGLPLALAFSKHFKVKGYDINERVLSEIKSGKDPNNELETFSINAESLSFHSDIDALYDCNVHIVTVPTPVTSLKLPDLGPLKAASKSVAKILNKGDLVIYESTVYPGCTEEDCIPVLEKYSGLQYKLDFKVAYSPERINPGDKKHTLENTVKIVSACDNDTCTFVKTMYERIVKAGIYTTRSIKVAEAAKIIENTQRDLNIALMNELSIIFDLMGINTLEVLEAASTKWNFQKYTPGLVGGHCISVDPYYLTYKSQELGYHPEIILSGRKVNDNLSKHILKRTLQFLEYRKDTEKEARVLILGISFKENVSDIRNSKTIEVARELIQQNVELEIYDPHVDAIKLKEEYDLELVNEIGENYDCVMVAVKHKEFESFDEDYFLSITNENPVLIDIKSIYKDRIHSMRYWSL
jgi:UDP-N-acetyl-D-galactosamine dehydrogenase